MEGLIKDCAKCIHSKIAKSGIVYCYADNKVKGQTIQKWGCINFKCKEG